MGGGLFLVAVVAITVLGGLEYLQALFALRNKSAVNRPKAKELDPIMRATGPGNNVNANVHAAAEPFFNSKFQVQAKTPTSSCTATARSTRRPAHR